MALLRIFVISITTASATSSVARQHHQAAVNRRLAVAADAHVEVHPLSKPIVLKKHTLPHEVRIDAQGVAPNLEDAADAYPEFDVSSKSVMRKMMTQSHKAHIVAQVDFTKKSTSLVESKMETQTDKDDAFEDEKGDGSLHATELTSSKVKASTTANGRESASSRSDEKQQTHAHHSNWMSYNPQTLVREVASHRMLTYIPREDRDTAGCPKRLKNPDEYWKSSARDDGSDFAIHHHNLTDRHGRSVNNLTCSDCLDPPEVCATNVRLLRKCTRDVTQGERYDAIVRALAGAAELFAALEVPYYLSSGTLIGQWRCGESLPWSEDADIHVPESALHVMFHKLFGRERKHVPANQMLLHEDNPLVPPGVVVWSTGWGGKKIQPMGIGDRDTGFYVDVWEEVELNRSSFDENAQVVRYWQHGPTTCPRREGFATTRCFKFPRKLVYPLRECKLNGVSHKCPHDTLNFLATEYGIDVVNPPEQYSSLSSPRAPPTPATLVSPSLGPVLHKEEIATESDAVL